MELTLKEVMDLLEDRLFECKSGPLQHPVTVEKLML